MKSKSNGPRLLLLLVLAATTLPSLGCLAAGLVVAGAAAAGAGTYTYVQGRLVRDYPAGFQETAQATQAALVDLGFPILKRDGSGTAITYTTETSKGTKVTIDLTTQVSPIPAEGSVTRVGIRVGWTGDEGVSAAILDKIGIILVTAGRGPRPGAVPGALQPVAATLPLPVHQASPIPVRVAETPGAIRPQPAPDGWRGSGQ